MSSQAAENSSPPQPQLIEWKEDRLHTPLISGAQRHPSKDHFLVGWGVDLLIYIGLE
jgi:hypothetical protein